MEKELNEKNLNHSMAPNIDEIKIPDISEFDENEDDGK